MVTGEFRPGGVGQEWCDADVLRSIRRRSLAKLRQEVEPVPTTTLARYTPSWQSVGSRMRGVDGVLAVVEQLAGALVPASALETLVLPSRVQGYQPGMLDELTSAGEVLWAGPAGWPAATAGSPWCRPTWPRCCCPTRRWVRRTRAGSPSRCSRSWPVAARCSSAVCPTWWAPPTTRPSPRPCGTWSGQAG